MLGTQKSFHRNGISIAMAMALGSLTTTASADALSDLKAQLEALQQKVNELEKKQAAPAPAPAPSNVVTGGATKGSFKLPGSDTSVTLGGYIKLDAIYSDRSAGVNTQGDQFLFPSLIPIGPTAGNNERGQTTFHARQSRLFVKTSMPSSFGDITTLLEGDFFGADGNESVSNSNSFRIRHAYGSIGNFSAGQFWTNFENEAALAETLDFGGPVGELFVRQAQVRWTQKWGLGDWSVSLENPESVLAVPGTATTFRADDDKYPDITGRVKFNTSAGNYSVAVLARNIRIDSGAAPVATSSKWGGAVSIAGIVPSIGKDDFRFNVNAGNVLGRYQELGFFTDGVVDTNGQVQLADEVSGYVAYRHFWTGSLRSSLVLSASRAKLPTGTFGLINKSANSAHLNLIWSPVSPVNLGVELITANREVQNGTEGDLKRVQFSAQYGF